MAGTGKRSATSNLNHDNWDQEEEPEEPGVFKKADKGTMHGRKILRAKRTAVGAPAAGSGSSAFKDFKGFGQVKPSSGVGLFGATAAGPSLFALSSTTGSSLPSLFSTTTTPGSVSVPEAPVTKPISVPFASSVGSKDSTEARSDSSQMVTVTSTTATIANLAKSNQNGSTGFGSANSGERPATVPSDGKLTITGKTALPDASIAPSVPPSTKPFQLGTSGFSFSSPGLDKAATGLGAFAAAAAGLGVGKSNLAKAAPVVSSLAADNQLTSKASVTVSENTGVQNTLTFSGTSTDHLPTSTLPASTSPTDSSIREEEPVSKRMRPVDEESTNVSQDPVEDEAVTKRRRLCASRYFYELKRLNEEFSKYVSMQIEKNPFVSLTPTLQSYIKMCDGLDEQYNSPGCSTTSLQSSDITDVKAKSSASSTASSLLSSEPLDASEVTASHSSRTLNGTDDVAGKTEAPATVVQPLALGVQSSTSAHGAVRPGDKSGFQFGDYAKQTKEDPLHKVKPVVIPQVPQSFEFGKKTVEGTAPSTTSVSGGLFQFGKAKEKTRSTTVSDVPGSGAVLKILGTTTTSTDSMLASSTAPSNPFAVKPIISSSPFSFTPTTTTTSAPSNILNPSFFMPGIPSTKTSLLFPGVSSDHSTHSSQASSANTSEGEGEEAEEDKPPVVEAKDATEEGSFFNEKCKLFFMNSEKSWTIRGSVATLFLKELPADGGAGGSQLIVRDNNVLSTILLNVRLSALHSIKVVKNSITFVCVPNPPVNPKEPNKVTSMLVRVKTVEKAESIAELFKKG